MAEAHSCWYKPICHFHVILSSPRFACPCARTSRHLIFSAFIIASICVPVCTHFEASHFHYICHCLGLRARVHALRGISFSLYLSSPWFACPCARTSRHLIFSIPSYSRFACPCARTSRHLISIAFCMLGLYLSCISCMPCILHHVRNRS